MRQSAAARQTEAIEAPATHTSRKSKSRPAAGRPSRVAALHEEAARIEVDLRELRDDFETRIKPLAKAYAAAIAKLEKLTPPSKRPKRKVHQTWRGLSNEG